MSGVNKVILLGRLTRDPELKQASVSICNMGIATSREWKDDSGEKKEKVEFHNVVAFKKLAELCAKYLVKGQQVFIEGELQTKSWEDAGVKKYRTEILANNVQFLGKSEKSEANGNLGDPVF